MSQQRASAADGFSSAAEEATRLVDALGEWLAARAGGLGTHLATGASECRICPLCQVIGLLRQARPEIVEHLDDAAGSLLAALRLALDGAEGGRASGRPAGFENIDIS
jgi:hypothetical protein